MHLKLCQLCTCRKIKPLVKDNQLWMHISNISKRLGEFFFMLCFNVCFFKYLTTEYFSRAGPNWVWPHLLPASLSGVMFYELKCQTSAQFYKWPQGAAVGSQFSLKTIDFWTPFGQNSPPNFFKPFYCFWDTMS